MFDFFIDADGSMLKNGSFSLTSSTSEYVAQKIRVALNTILNEWYLDSKIGMPYWDMTNKDPNVKVLQAAMKAAILEIKGVSELTSFTMSYDGSIRKVTIKFIVKTVDDETVEGTV